MKINIVEKGLVGYEYPPVREVAEAIFPGHNITSDGHYVGSSLATTLADGITLTWTRFAGWRGRQYPTQLHLSFRSALTYRLVIRRVSIKNGELDEAAVRKNHAELVALKAEGDALAETARQQQKSADERLRELRTKVGDCALAFIYSADRYELHTPPLTEAQVISIAEAVKDILEVKP